MKKALVALVSTAILSGTVLAKDYDSITIATDAPYGKFEYLVDGELTGFEVDLGNEACKRAGIECKWEVVVWDAIFAGLEARKYEAIISSVSIKPDREEKFLFSVPYYNTPSAWIAANDTDIDPADKATLKGKNVGVQVGTLQDEYVTDFFGDIVNVKRYQGGEEVFEDIKSGRLDTFFIDYAVAAEAFLPENSDYGVVGEYISAPVEYFGKGVGVVMRKRDTELKARFDEALASIFADGTYDTIMNKYFDYDISVHKK